MVILYRRLPMEKFQQPVLKCFRVIHKFHKLDLWLNGGKGFRRSRDAEDLVMNVESIRTADAPAVAA